MDAVLSYLRELNLCSMCLRIVLAMVLGGFLGLDREIQHRPAGFRTYMLVAMAAATAAILSQYLDLMLNTLWHDAYTVVGKRTDVVRLGAQVISGIGFLGTGTIMITERKEVTGLTTACCLWAAACMGLAIGAGFYECVLLGFFIVAFVMRFLPLLEQALMSSARRMNIFVETDSLRDLHAVSESIKASGIYLYDVEMGKRETGGISHITGIFSVRLAARRKHTEVLAELALLPGIVAIEEV